MVNQRIFIAASIMLRLLSIPRLHFRQFFDRLPGGLRRVQHGTGEKIEGYVHPTKGNKEMDESCMLLQWLWLFLSLSSSFNSVVIEVAAFSETLDINKQTQKSILV